MSWKRPSFGHAGEFLRAGKPFFNKDNPTVLADAVVTVCGDAEAPVFHVFDIEQAESLAQSRALEWFATPKKDGSQRSENFPMSFRWDDPLIAEAMGNWDVLKRLRE